MSKSKTSNDLFKHTELMWKPVTHILVHMTQRSTLLKLPHPNSIWCGHLSTARGAVFKPLSLEEHKPHTWKRRRCVSFLAQPNLPGSWLKIKCIPGLVRSYSIVHRKSGIYVHTSTIPKRWENRGLGRMNVLFLHEVLFLKLERNDIMWSTT